jgi:nucleoside-diphosphate-sugar epimerase
LGTLNLINALRSREFDLFVNIGSSSEYGFKEKSMKESDILKPNSYYAVAKAAQTHLCSYEATSNNLPIVTLRPFSVYGPFEEPGRLIPNMMRAFYKNGILSMVSKDVARDFIFIEDFVDACLHVGKLRKYPGEVFNIGSGKEVKLHDLINTFQEVTKIKGQVTWKTLPGKKWDANHWLADVEKSKKMIDFKPRHSIRSGLQKSWEWFKTNHNHYD